MEKTIFTLKKFIISYVNYRTLHVKQPDVASGVRPETKPLLVAHQAGAYPGFHSMTRLGVHVHVFLLPPAWDASPSQEGQQQIVRQRKRNDHRGRCNIETSEK